MQLHKLLIPILIAPSLFITGCNINELNFTKFDWSDLNIFAEKKARYALDLNFLTTPSLRPVMLNEAQQQVLQDTLQSFITECEKAAKKGDTAMQYELGLMYLHGFLTPPLQQLFFAGIKTTLPGYLCKTTQDIDKAAYWIGSAIRQGNEAALSSFFLFDDEKIISYRPQIKKDIKYLADKGNTAAKAALGLTYLSDTWGEEESPETALKYIRANMDEPLAKYGLAWMYLTNRVVDEDFYFNKESGLKLMRETAQQGCELAIKDLADISYIAFFSDPEHELALSCYTQLLQRYPFATTWLNNASLILRELNSTSLDEQFGPFIIASLLNAAYGEIDFSNDALSRLLSFAAKDRLGFSLFEYMYLRGEQTKRGDTTSQDFTIKNTARFKRVKQEVDNGAFEFAPQMLFYYSRVGDKNVQDSALAQHYAQLAEKYDNADNLDLLATLYLLGIDLPFDADKAISLLQRAQDKGSDFAKTLLADIQKQKQLNPQGQIKLDQRILDIMLKRKLSVDLN